jgi:hypothetical protein
LAFLVVFLAFGIGRVEAVADKSLSHSTDRENPGFRLEWLAMSAKSRLYGGIKDIKPARQS